MTANHRVRIIISLILSASIISLSACTEKNSAASTTEAAAAAATASSEEGLTTVYGKVTAVSGSAVTLAIGTLNSQTAMGTPPAAGTGSAGGTGETEAGTNSGTGSQTAGTPPALPSGNEQTDASGSSSQGAGQPSGMGGDLLTLTGDSLVITVTDSTIYSSRTISGPGSQAAPDTNAAQNASNTSAAATAASTASAASAASTAATPATAATALSLSDITVGTVLQVTYKTSTSKAVSVEIITGMGGGATGNGAPGGSASVDTGTGAYVVTDGEALSSKTYTSTNADENAIRAEGTTTASLDGVTVEKTDGSASSNDASSFYGLNSAILALDKATLNITGGTVTATAEGANGVFAYDGATINITGTVINVSGGNAGGIEVSGGGTMNAKDLTVNSTVKAAIRSDRGGGTMVVSGGTYTTSGSTGAPAIYSTADITVSDAKLTANDSEAVVVEGLNSVTLNNCDVTGNMNGTYGDSSGKNIHNVMLYQSMSGDAETGTSSFTMTGGSLVSKNGDMFYVTNTDCVISLSGVTLSPADGTNLLTVSGNDGSNGWGTAGANGGTCAFNLSKQTLAGNISVDTISKLAMTISNSSSFTGSINSDKTTASSLSVTIDGTSKWTLTADSYITSFNGSMNNVVTNGHTLYVNGTAMN